MKKLWAALLVFVFISNSSYALLPPLYTSLEEYRQLINSKELSAKLGSGQAIQSIERVENGFVIQTPRYTLHVDVIHEPQEHPGPARFHLEFHAPIPKQQD